MPNLSIAAKDFTLKLKQVIETSIYNNELYENGEKAKEALIRSQTLINLFHEYIKIELNKELSKQGNFLCHPPIGKRGPELKIYGEFKKKAQDVVFTNKQFSKEKIKNLNEIDYVGYEASNSSLTVGVRSQMSSVDKNFDTLMERAIAEAVNLNSRLPNITLGEIYVIPLQELCGISCRENKFITKKRSTNIEKFIHQFYNSTRKGYDKKEYEIDANCLLIIDLNNPGNFIKNELDLKSMQINEDICNKFNLIKPDGFIDRLINWYNYNNKS